MKKAILAATLVCVAGMVSACGDDGPPTDASKEDFCDQVTQLAKVTDGSSLKDWADGMEKVGTPEGIPDDAQAGLEAILDTAGDVEDGAVATSMEGIQSDLSPEQKADVTAFGQYAATTCADSLKDLIPSDLPSS